MSNTEEDPSEDEDGASLRLEVKKRVSSVGKTWEKRRKLERESSDESDSMKMNVFGARLLEARDFIQKRGHEWKRYAEINVPKDITDFQIKIKKRRLESEIELVGEKLVALSKTMRQSLTAEFTSFFSANDKLCREYMQFAKKQTETNYIKELHIRTLLSKDGKATSNIYARTTALLFVEKFVSNQNHTKRLLLPFLEWHGEQVAERAEKMKPEFNRLKKRFAEQISDKIASGELPLSESVAKERLRTLKFIPVDAFEAKLNETWGDFEGKNHIGRVATSVPEKYLWHVFAHESLHALSGQTEQVFSIEGINDSYSEIQKVGLSFSRHDSLDTDHANELRCNWLNEAITEDLTMDFTDKKESFSYTSERKMLEKLLNSGVPKKLFLGAYFENYIPKNKKLPFPEMRKLFDAINQKFYPGFIADLDILHRAKSEAKGRSDATKEIVEEWDKDSEAFIKNLRDQANIERRKRK